MTLVLTGDLHHSINSTDQRFASQSEATTALEYTRIAASHGLKVTLFLTGRSIVEDVPASEALLAMGNVEIGGHGWDALRPRWWHSLLRGLTGSPHGPYWLQKRMILRTRTAIECFTKQPMAGWRNHAYRHDCHTPHLLAEAGVEVWSDEVELGRQQPYRHSCGIVVLPINTLPDHESLYHGMRTPERVALERRGPSYHPTEWSDLVCSQVETIVSARGVATVLAHPICMSVVDRFATFERLCARLSGYPSSFASEVAVP